MGGLSTRVATSECRVVRAGSDVTRLETDGLFDCLVIAARRQREDNTWDTAMFHATSLQYMPPSMTAGLNDDQLDARLPHAGTWLKEFKAFVRTGMTGKEARPLEAIAVTNAIPDVQIVLGMQVRLRLYGIPVHLSAVTDSRGATVTLDIPTFRLRVGAPGEVGTKVSELERLGKRASSEPALSWRARIAKSAGRFFSWPHAQAASRKSA